MLRRVFSSLALLALLAAPVLAQEDPELAPPLADDNAGWVERGVLKVIPPEPQDAETFTANYELHEVLKGIPGLDYTPEFEAKTGTVYERAKDVTLRRPIWALEFSFKPVRMIQVDVPQPEGRMRRKTIWYLLYRVRNLGGHLQPTPQPGQSEEVRTGIIESELTDEEKALAQKEIERQQLYDAQEVDELPKDAFPQIVFFPTISLVAHDVEKEYLDRVIPAALPQIAKRERVGKPLYDSVTISRQKILVTTADQDNSVWGVAMWEDVDPRIDFFSVYVQGLTNAYLFADKPSEYKAGDKPGKGRSFSRKTLVLHFWRPGDTIDENEKEFFYGMPIESDPAEQQAANAKYGEKDRLDHRWIYQ